MSVWIYFTILIISDKIIISKFKNHSPVQIYLAKNRFWENCLQTLHQMS